MKCLKNWRDKLPIVKWLPHYTINTLQRDFIAGITVGLMVIPQGLAYAVIAGLHPVYGLYSAFMGGFVYCFLGSSKDISLGPTAIMSLMVSNYANKHDPVDFAVALSFFCGMIWLTMGLLSLGFIVRVIPLPVISGFTSSAAIIIACSQLKSLFGLSGIPRDFILGLVKVASKIGETKVWDLILGFICMLSLELLRRFNKIQWPSEEESPPTACQRVSRKIIWLVCVGRNAIVVFASALIALSFHSESLHPFSLTGKVQEGLPAFKVPKLTSNALNKTISTGHMISDIGSGFLVVPLIGFLENIAIAQAFSRRNHYTVDPSQELFALGVANIAGSFFSGYPITGSFSRTTVNAISGVATPLGGVFTGCVVLLALSVLTPFFQYIPKASLASIIIMSVLRMIDWKIIKEIWKITQLDITPLFVTFFVCFYQIDIGIMCGVLASLIIVLYRHFFPRIGIRGKFLPFVKINGGLTYMGTEFFKSQVRQIAFLGGERPEIVIVDCATMFECDFTVSQAFMEVVQDCKGHNIEVIVFNAQDNVKEMLVNAGLPLELFRDDLDESFCGLLHANANALLSIDGRTPAFENNST